MVRRITSNAIIESSNEKEGAGHGGSSEISSLSSSSSSGSENNSPSNHLEEVFHQILSGKTKMKAKKKPGTTRGTNGNASEYVPCISDSSELVLPQRIKPQPLETNWMANQ